VLFGNSIPWSEVQIQLLRRGHKLDFLKLGADLVSSVSFLGELKHPLVHSSFHYHYLNPLIFADPLSGMKDLSCAAAFPSAAELLPCNLRQKVSFS